MRFELLVGSVVSPAALATFRVPLTPTRLPRKSVYRLRVPADRDLVDVVQRLTERDVELIEIRCCPQTPPPVIPAAPDAGSGSENDLAPEADGVVVPLRAAARGGARRGSQRGSARRSRA